MALTIYERHKTRGFMMEPGGRTFVRSYCVVGSTNENDVEAKLVNETPSLINGFPRTKITCEFAGGDVWFADVEYGTGDPNDAVGTTPRDEVSEPKLDEPLDGGFSIDTMAQEVHITQARGTMYRRIAQDADKPDNFIGSGPDEKLAIGLTKDKVEGCDIYAGAFKFSRTVQRPHVTMRYINSALYRLVGKVNDRPFYNFGPGEVLYLGCTGDFTIKDRWKLTHNFACSPNELDVWVSDRILIPSKGGWEYVWVSYDFEEQDFGGKKLLVQVPKIAYCQQVYDKGDFTKLEIGGSDHSDEVAKKRFGGIAANAVAAVNEAARGGRFRPNNFGIGNGRFIIQGGEVKFNNGG